MSVMLRVLAVSLVAACGFSAKPGGNNGTVDAARGGEPGDPDAAIDAMIDAPMFINCHGSFKSVCLPTLPPLTLDFASKAIDTDGTTDCITPAAGSAIASACIVAAGTITINGTLRATGSKPLIVIATTSFTINGNGVIDVASRGTERGAGSRMTCNTGGGGAGGNAGGIGGSFATRGGLGGSGGTGSSGSQQAIAALQDLVGGCAGFNGGGIAVVNRGPGGFGGGAVLVISPSIIVNNRINASGAGGGGGLTGLAGGGGGGSGGAIVLDTPNLTLNGGALLWAQGGGGGEGAATVSGGDPGDPGSTPGTAAAGGSGINPQGGDGGNGAVSNDASNGNNGNDGGGGGGGGAGYVRTTDTSVPTGGSSFPPISTI